MTAPMDMREGLLARLATLTIDDQGHRNSELQQVLVAGYVALKWALPLQAASETLSKIVALTAPAQGCVNPNDILADIVQRWNDLKRDEGAFPPGDRRAAMSEHRLWHAIQAAKAWLSAFPSTECKIVYFDTDLSALADRLVGIQEDLPSENDRAALGEAAHYLRKYSVPRPERAAPVKFAHDDYPSEFDGDDE